MFAINATKFIKNKSYVKNFILIIEVMDKTRLIYLKAMQKNMEKQRLTDLVQNQAKANTRLGLQWMYPLKA